MVWLKNLKWMMTTDAYYSPLPLPQSSKPHPHLQTLFLSLVCILTIFYHLTSTHWSTLSNNSFKSLQAQIQDRINQLGISDNLSDSDLGFLSGLSTNSIQSTSRRFTQHAHLAGTSQDQLTAYLTQSIWESLLGLSPKADRHVFDAGTSSSKKILTDSHSKPQVWIDRYYPLVTFPGQSSSIILRDSISNLTLFKASLLEDSHSQDPTARNGSTRFPAFHGYSQAGIAQGALVYANYGRLEDFQRLEKFGISLKDRIVLVRYGGLFRGLKVSIAESFGAVGVIIYSDLAEDGQAMLNQTAYPHGPGRERSSIQRGSVQNLAYCPGDPLTPFEPAYKNAKRVKKPGNLPGIPSLPISWNDAQPLLKSLEGHGHSWKHDLDWAGLGPFGYFTGPSNLSTVEIVNDVTHNITAIWNTYALIPGHINDQVVMIGNHRDAWIFGAADPISGMAVTTEILKSFSYMLRTGWKPHRTILFASWDGEELGLIGSTEFVEDHQTWIRKHLVTYLNTDVAASGSLLGLSTSPSLAPLFLNVSQLVPDPINPHMTLYDRLATQQPNQSHPSISPLGSGSDFTPFLQHVGIASADMGFGPKDGDPAYHYHSLYDSTYWMETFGDPGYKRHLAITRLLGLATLRLIESKILPIDLGAYATSLAGYVDQLPSLQGLNLVPLRRAIERLGSAIKDTRPEPIRTYNHILARFEEGFIDRKGLTGRPWYRNLIIAPGLNLGYGATPLPGLSEAISLEKNLDRAKEELDRIVKVIDINRKRLNQFNKKTK